MKQKQFPAILLLTLIATLFSGCDSEPPKPQAVVINVQEIAKATGFEEQMNTRTETANQQLTDELKALSDRLNKEIQDENDNLGDSPSAEVEKKIQVLRAQMFQKLMQAQAAGNERLEKEASDIRQSFLDDIMSLAQAVALEHGASIVLKAVGVFWSDGSVDITGEVIERMSGDTNEQSASREQNGAENVR